MFWNHTRYRVINGDLYAQRFQVDLSASIYRTCCFMKISLQSLEQIQLVILNLPYMQLFWERGWIRVALG